MTTPRIVILDGATLNPGDNPWAEIKALGEVEVFADSTPEQTAERLTGADVAITNKVVLNRELLESLPALKFIAVTATGYDCVDVVAARELDLPVCTTGRAMPDLLSWHWDLVHFRCGCYREFPTQPGFRPHWGLNPICSLILPQSIGC